MADFPWAAMIFVVIPPLAFTFFGFEGYVKEKWWRYETSARIARDIISPTRFDHIDANSSPCSGGPIQAH